MNTVHITPEILRPIALELRYLRLVVAIQDFGGLTRASDQLHVTQSALSHQLREIEDRLGVQLFLRVGKKLVATEAGERLTRAGREILASVIEAEDDLVARARDRRGTLRLTTECYTCYEWLPPLLKRFEPMYPEVRVDIVSKATGCAAEALLDGTVDLTISTVQPTNDVRARHLFDDELMLITSPDHRFVSMPYVVPADLVDERVILFGPPSESRFYREFFANSPVVPREILQINLTQATVAMISAGMAVAPLAAWSVREDLENRRVATVRLGPTGLRRQWHALTRTGRRVPRYIDDFIDLMIESAVPNISSAA